MAVTRGGRAELWSPASAAYTPDHRLGTAADDAVSSSQILCRLLCLFEDKDLVDMIQGKMWANCVDIVDVDTDETQSTGLNKFIFKKKRAMICLKSNRQI